MKKTWFFLALTFAIILAIGLGNIWLLNHGVEKMGEILVPLEQAVYEDNWEGAAHSFAKLDEVWRQERKLWQITIDHKDTETIEVSLANLEAGIALKDRITAITAIYAVSHNIEHILYVEKLSWQNIL